VHVRIVERNLRGMERTRSGGDEDDIRGEHALGAARIADDHPRSAMEDGGAVDQLDAVSLEVPSDRLLHHPRDLRLAGMETLHGELRGQPKTDAVDLTSAKAREVEGRLAKRLSRDAGVSDGGSTHPRGPFD
jgi:hypothetical protein